MVQRLIESECRVYLVEWARPDSHAQTLGLDDYVGRLLLKCLDVIQTEAASDPLFGLDTRWAALLRPYALGCIYSG